ncbi:hypothetical protein ACU8V7_21215 [Zobellia nedashkovskayae]
MWILSTIPKGTGDYYANANYNETMRSIRGMQFPESTPITNVFPENSFPYFPEMLSTRWKKLQDELAEKKQKCNSDYCQRQWSCRF